MLAGPRGRWGRTHRAVRCHGKSRGVLEGVPGVGELWGPQGTPGRVRGAGTWGRSWEVPLDWGIACSRTGWGTCPTTAPSPSPDPCCFVPSAPSPGSAFSSSCPAHFRFQPLPGKERRFPQLLLPLTLHLIAPGRAHAAASPTPPGHQEHGRAPLPPQDKQKSIAGPGCHGRMLGPGRTPRQAPQWPQTSSPGRGQQPLPQSLLCAPLSALHPAPR